MTSGDSRKGPTPEKIGEGAGKMEFEAEEARVPESRRRPAEAIEVGREAAEMAIERAETEYPPIRGEFDQAPPSFERD